MYIQKANLQQHLNKNNMESNSKKKSREQIQALAKSVLTQISKRCGTCRSCRYGRPRCAKVLPLSFQLSPTHSTYISSFKRNSSIPNNKIEIPLEKRNRSVVVTQSSYKVQYPSRDHLAQPPKPIRYEDHLKQGDRIKTQSSYRSDYPSGGYKAIRDEKIINPQSWPSVASIKLNSCSIYRSNYKANRLEKLSPLKREDYLKVHGQFIGESTYKHYFLPLQGDRTQILKPKYQYSPKHFPHIETTYQANYVYPSQTYQTILTID